MAHFSRKMNGTSHNSPKTSEFLDNYLTSYNALEPRNGIYNNSSGTSAFLDNCLPRYNAIETRKYEISPKMLAFLDECFPSHNTIEQRKTNDYTTLSVNSSAPLLSSSSTKETGSTSVERRVQSYSPFNNSRYCPLFELDKDGWDFMCKNDEMALLERNPEMLKYHPELTCEMRAILFDWLIFICNLHGLRRDTYYLAVDIFDRFLSSNDERATVTPHNLQLVIITCLFIASKIEEISQLKLADLTYITNDECKREDIILKEKTILNVLDWRTRVFTIIDWLYVYIQLYDIKLTKLHESSLEVHSNVNQSKEITYEKFPRFEFKKAAQLLDLCTFDIELGRFSYSILAASAVAHILNKSTAMYVSGYLWNIIEPCYKWMFPFYKVFMESTTFTYVFANTNKEDDHEILTNHTPLNMMEKVKNLQKNNNWVFFYGDNL